MQFERRIDAGAQIQTCGTFGRISRQWILVADARIEDANFQRATVHAGLMRAAINATRRRATSILLACGISMRSSCDKTMSALSS